MDIKIIPFTKAHLDKLRYIACETAWNGEAIEKSGLKGNNIRSLVGELLVSYYVQFEPHLCWLASLNNELCGYLLASANTKQFIDFMKRKILPKCFLLALLNGAFFNAALLKLLWTNRKNFIIANRKKIIDLTQYPAHLHINLLKKARGLGIGNYLMQNFLNYAQRIKISGVHIWVREDNASAISFFKKYGFQELGKTPFIWINKETLLYSIAMGLLIKSEKTQL